MGTNCVLKTNCFTICCLILSTTIDMDTIIMLILYKGTEIESI